MDPSNSNKRTCEPKDEETELSLLSSLELQKELENLDRFFYANAERKPKSQIPQNLLVAVSEDNFQEVQDLLLKANVTQDVGKLKDHSSCIPGSSIAAEAFHKGDVQSVGAVLNGQGHNEEVESNLLSKEAVERRSSLRRERSERPSSLDNLESFLLVAQKNGHDELFTVLSEFRQAEILRLRISAEQNGLLLG